MEQKHTLDTSTTETTSLLLGTAWGVDVSSTAPPTAHIPRSLCSDKRHKQQPKARPKQVDHTNQLFGHMYVAAL